MGWNKYRGLPKGNVWNPRRPDHPREVERQDVRRGLFTGRFRELLASQYEGQRPPRKVIRDMARQWMHRTYRGIHAHV